MTHRFSRRVLALLLLGVVLWITGCTGKQQADTATRQVTIYVSSDRRFAEPVLQAYEKRTGIKVNAAYDTEGTTTTGLANRLLAEKNPAQADVFWSNEPVRTLMLKKNGVLAPYKSASAEPLDW